MIKALLGLSLFFNGVLGYLYLTRPPEKEVVERLIIETHAAPKITTQKKTPPAPVVKEARKENADDKKEKDPLTFSAMDSHELQDAGERMENDRMEFLAVTLGMSEEKIAEHNKIRDEFYKESAQYWQKSPMRELNFKERRKMLEMEEQLHNKLEKLHGKKNWEAYQKYRESYNQKGFKRQTEDNQPFIFMGL
jgi:hypothetical protein